MYPDGAVAGNLVGYMGLDGEPLGGLEQTQDSCLAATNGSMTYEKGKDGVIIPGTEVKQDAVNGGTLALTIDRDLQWYMQQLVAEQVQDMGALSGTITVVEAKTGKIRAAADYPTLDPNNVEASDPKDRGSRIFINTFEPGSTFKPLTAATLIEAGGQTPASTVTAAGKESFPNGARVGDSFNHPQYTYTLAGVLIDSSNVGISKFAERVSPQVRYDFLKKFGIGDGSEIPFNGQPKGDLRTPDKWDNQSFYNIAFGQGVSTTIPELMGAYQALANDGVKIPLSLVESCTKADGTVVKPTLSEPRRVVSESTAVAVQQMMENVALQSTLSDQVAIAGYNVADKTGTGEKTDGNGHYKSGVYFTTMIGFAPAEDPQYIVAVTLDEPTRIRSSGANASAWQKAMTQVLKTYRVMPSTEAPTLLPKFG
jgi:cell division protein FtsI (penicillin-binding protein 3)